MPFAAKTIAEAADFLVQSKRRVQGPLWMVFVRNRSAKQRENAVSGRLHNVAVIAAHGIDHQLQSRIDDRSCLFRVKILLKRGRIYDVDEKRGNEFPPAFR